LERKWNLLSLADMQVRLEQHFWQKKNHRKEDKITPIKEKT
jgi:hypothetical protein